MDNLTSCRFAYSDKKFIVRLGARGGGCLKFYCAIYGTDKIIAELIRIKLKYPYWQEADHYINRVVKIRSNYGF